MRLIFLSLSNVTQGISNIALRKVSDLNFIKKIIKIKIFIKDDRLNFLIKINYK